MNNKLRELYRSVFTIENIKKIPEREKLSAPLLINVYDSYINSKLKIMFVGKETNHWLTHQSRDEDEKGINYLLNHYETAFHSLFQRYENAFIDNDGSKKSAFFSQYMNIRKQLTSNELGSIVWNNIYKLSYDQNNGFSKSSKSHKEVCVLSKQLFLEELNILEPDVIIFVTCASYDSEIKKYLNEYKTIDVPIKKRLWKFKHKLKNKDIL